MASIYLLILLCVLLVYVLLSLLFFYYPLLLHRKIQPTNKLMCQMLNNDHKVIMCSHRGGAHEKLENTIEAFENAVRLGSNSIEFDVNLTKDQKIVVIHDSKLTRLSNVNMKVSDFDYSELPGF